MSDVAADVVRAGQSRHQSIQLLHDRIRNCVLNEADL